MTSSATPATVALIFEILEERTIGRRGHCYFDPTFAESLGPIGEH
ncbi:hypothetical protein [Ensifer sp. BR816]|nr:hypothetical protein [Ensifer sp. BR816]